MVDLDYLIENSLTLLKKPAYSLTYGGAQALIGIGQDEGTMWHSKAPQGDRWEDNRTGKKN